MKNIIPQEWNSFYLKDVSFVNLMTRRIFNVLIVANPYDAFMLEDDGRVDEKIFNEYTELGLRYPPTFTQVSTIDEASRVLNSTSIDLVICMPGNADNDAFTVARAIKASFAHIPCVVLTPSLIECNVLGAKDVPTARALAKSVISSSLVKAAFFGKDANWGRILCAMGYSGEVFDPDKTSVSFSSIHGEQRPGATDAIGKAAGEAQSIMVFDHGVPLNFDEDLAKKILSEDAVTINVTCEDGNACGTAWGCDLTYDYVKINGDYRT